VSAEEIEQEAIALWNLDKRSAAKSYHGCEWDELSEATRNKFRREAGGQFWVEGTTHD